MGKLVRHVRGRDPALPGVGIRPPHDPLRRVRVTRMRSLGSGPRDIVRDCSGQLKTLVVHTMILFNEDLSVSVGLCEPLGRRTHPFLRQESGSGLGIASEEPARISSEESRTFR